MAKKKKNQPAPGSPRLKNKKAFHDYNILEKVECGMVLDGTEVKALRDGMGKIDEAYARITNGEVFLMQMSIPAYTKAGAKMQHEPKRKRKLLLNRRQIKLLETKTQQKGLTLVPLAIYFKQGWAKCEIGIAEGKRLYDKRQTLKDKQQKRDISREMRNR